MRISNKRTAYEFSPRKVLPTSSPSFPLKGLSVSYMSVLSVAAALHCILHVKYWTKLQTIGTHHFAACMTCCVPTRSGTRRPFHLEESATCANPVRERVWG